MKPLSERLELKRDAWRGTEFGDDICELLDEAAELARRVEDAPVVEIDSEAGEDVRLIAEGGPLDRMTTSVRVIGMHGQRVRLVPTPQEVPDGGR